MFLYRHPLIFICIYFLEKGCAYATAQAWRGQKTTCRSQFSSSTIWILGINGPGLVGSKRLYLLSLPCRPSPPYFLSQGLSMNLRLSISARMSNQQAPSICLSLHLYPQCWGSEAFHCTCLLRECSGSELNSPHLSRQHCTH